MIVNNHISLWGLGFFLAAYNKIQDFVVQLLTAKHDFTAAGHVMKVMLTNSAPVATNTIKGDLTDITAGNGYTAGGTDTQNTLAGASGTATVTCTNVVWTASGGTIGPFRYVATYNDTTSSPVKPLVNWWDYGSALTLADGESFTVKFDNQPATGTLFTIV